ncbi:Gfo/Idh/MocA family oxidoreductase [Castellaniella sp.]|uniref:Gfo/Idh/MocA family protein n=1 Tax=Castellaniella sp. TaxID=1955812 RepID=UPI002AFF95E7|nr:Gfo/Idh/MocA family oxidoreductase [Castellaniella sp.]
MKILFCGLGGIGQRHLRNLKALLGGDMEIHAYRVRGHHTKLDSTMKVEAGANLEHDYNITVHQDLANGLAAAPDAVFICNPNSLHMAVALECARAGVAIFMEKPVASNLEGAEELLQLTRDKNLLFYVGYNFRFHPGLNRIKELLDQKRFGNIISVQAEIGEYLPNWHPYEDYRQMYAARSDQGGGVILSQIHEMDLIYWFFGLPETILCRGGKLSKLEIDVEDTASSLMQYKNVGGGFPISLHQDFIQRPPTRRFKIAGDAGGVEIDLIRTQLRVYDGEGALVESSDFEGFTRNDMFMSQAKHFLDCLAGRATPEVELYDGLQSLRLALAAKQSLESGTEIILKDFGTNVS